MRALVIGGASSIARALIVCLREHKHDVVWTTRRQHESDLGAPACKYFDLLDPILPREITDIKFDVVYIMAAVTGIVPCERDPDAWRVNAYAPLAIARTAQVLGWHVVFPSSGTVELAPHTASALQKAYAEIPILMWGGTVVRLLPRVDPSKFPEVAELLVSAGYEARPGLLRWEG